MTNKLIAISIKTFNRFDTLKKCIESIYKHCDLPYRLYIADDSNEDLEKLQSLFEKLAMDGHVIKTYPERISVTKARNDILDLLQDEQYILRLDDDFHFSAETKISVMCNLLEARPEIGAIAGIERQTNEGKGVSSGEISASQGFLIFDKEVLRKVNVPVANWTWMRTGEHRFAIANFTRNFLLIRRDVFSDVRWNESLIIQGEHLAFMLDLQRAGWLLAFTPDSIHDHDDPNEKLQSYVESRNSAEGNDRRMGEFARKYNITKITLHDVLSLWNTHKDRSPTVLRWIIKMIRRFLFLMNKL